MQYSLKQLFFAISLCFFFYTSIGQIKSPAKNFTVESESDLNKIIKQVGTKRIVAIGEDTHGTKEFYALRIALTKKLILEKGFNVFILENPYEDMVALQDSLYSNSLDTLMKQHLFAIYQTTEMREFLIWLKDYNKTKKIKIAGCDDSYRDILPAKIAIEIGKYNDAILDRLALDFKYRQTLDVEEYYNLSQNKSDKPLISEIKYGYETYQLLTKLDSLINLRNSKNEMLDELLFQAKSNYEIYWGFMNKKFLSRDSAMGMRVNYFTSNSTNKIIIWAHNAHIVKSSLDGEIGKMGEIINKTNNANYFSIGFTAGGGTYSYLKSPFINNDHDFSDTLFNATLLAEKKDSWNEYLNHQKKDNYIINFNSLKKRQIDFFNIPKPLRVIGYKKENPEKIYFKKALYPLFDVLIYLKQTTHTTALFNNSSF